MPLALPSWLEQFRIPDGLCVQAYERASASLRAYLKTGIALAHFHFGSITSRTESRTENRHLGFCERKTILPADWACLIFDGNERATAKICAAAILPRLADVEDVFAICLGARPSWQVLLSLELCGCEDIFHIDGGQCADLVCELANMDYGRVCLLHRGQFDDLYLRLTNLGIVAVDLNESENLLLLDADAFDKNILQFCLGRMPETDPSQATRWDCVYAASPENVELAARIKLGPGCEGFWLFEKLRLGFYQIRAQEFWRV